MLETSITTNTSLPPIMIFNGIENVNPYIHGIMNMYCCDKCIEVPEFDSKGNIVLYLEACEVCSMAVQTAIKEKFFTLPSTTSWMKKKKKPKTSKPKSTKKSSY